MIKCEFPMDKRRAWLTYEDPYMMHKWSKKLIMLGIAGMTYLWPIEMSWNPQRSKGLHMIGEEKCIGYCHLSPNILTLWACNEEKC